MDKQNMKKIYNKLNGYLNEICNYLEKNDSFLLNNISILSKLNDQFLQFMDTYYNLDNQTIQNHLTFEDVYLLAREIIESIDPNYLPDFDNLIKNGELNFIYDQEEGCSYCRTIKIDDQIKQLIDINRQFNYDDVVVLIHEFIHYTNTKKRSENVNYLTEFLAIYFEHYTIDYLLKKGINKEEIDYLFRLKSIIKKTKNFFHYEMVLLAYVNFGNINENTIDDFHKYVADIKKEVFDKECINFCNVLENIEEKYQCDIKDEPERLGEILSSEFIIYDYKYIFGTFLAFLARKYSKLEDIIHLNNHINDYDDLNISDICLNIGINIKNPNLMVDILNSMIEYLEDKEVKKKK